MMKEEFVNYYDLMQISERASDEVVKAAYRALSKKYHPDGDSPDVYMMQKINKAYETLSDPEKRRRYDISLHSYKQKILEVKVAAATEATRRARAATSAGTGNAGKTAGTSEAKTAGASETKTAGASAEKTAGKNSGKRKAEKKSYPKGAYAFNSPEETYGPHSDDFLVNLDPEIETRFGWISNLLHNGQFSDAKRSLSELKTMVPRDPRVHVGLLLSEYRLHRFDGLETLNRRFDESENYANAVYFADDVLAYALRKHAFDYHARKNQQRFVFKDLPKYFRELLKEDKKVVYLCAGLVAVLFIILLIISL